ncbi:MAG: hypothetical protein LBS77_05765 [Desulfovibrio sp.]|jgi:metallo-beta-lactamase family protein|nr:hypothetical protein [Desulfovibrio sp.]
MEGSALVISASGMCTPSPQAHNIWRYGASIVFVGYQAVGTPGRKLVENVKKSFCFGKMWKWLPEFSPSTSFSGTPGNRSCSTGSGLLLSRARALCVHEEEWVQHTLAGLIEQQFGITPFIPDYLEEIDLAKGRVAQTVLHEDAAHPVVNWDFLICEEERKWTIFKGKLVTVREKLWMEKQTWKMRLGRMNTS